MEIIIDNQIVSKDQIEEIKELLFLKKDKEQLKVILNHSTIDASVYENKTLYIHYSHKSYIFRSLFNYACKKSVNTNFQEKRFFNHFGVMLDCSRNGVASLSFIKKFIQYLALMGYTFLQLYTEDTYEIKEEPYFGYMRGRYSQKELKELDVYANQYGIELIPCIQTLAHLNTLFRWPEYEKIQDINDILLVNEPRTYELIENMFKTTRQCFSSNRIHIGMDEAFLLGFGKYYQRYGNVDRMEIMLEHLQKVSDIARKYHYTCIMWSDMFYRLAFGGYYDEKNGKFDNKIVKKIPSNIELMYWDYYSDKQEHFEKIMEQHKQFNNPIWFAGGAWTYTGFLPNNAFSIREVKASVLACRNQNVQEYLMTMWGDNGNECSRFSVLPVLLYLSEYAYGNQDDAIIYQKFKTLTHFSLESFLIAEKMDKVGNVTNAEFTDPSKYLLYNDCFCGIYDSSISVENGKEYREIAKSLKPFCKDRKWGYIFKSHYCLAKVLELKITLGVKTRKIYQKQNKMQLQKLALQDYSILIKRIENFSKAFKNLWYKENKSFGYEVHNYRLGGLCARLKHCQKQLLDYCNGKIEKIEELEIELLDVFGNEKNHIKQLAYINQFDKTFTINNY